jgi:hypothetical protein
LPILWDVGQDFRRYDPTTHFFHVSPYFASPSKKQTRILGYSQMYTPLPSANTDIYLRKSGFQFKCEKKQLFFRYLLNYYWIHRKDLSVLSTESMLNTGSRSIVYETSIPWSVAYIKKKTPDFLHSMERGLHCMERGLHLKKAIGWNSQFLSNFAFSLRHKKRVGVPMFF